MMQISFSVRSRRVRTRILQRFTVIATGLETEAAPAQSILPGVKFNGGNTLNMARTAGTGSAKPVQPTAPVQNYNGIQRPQKPTPTVAPRDIKIPEFLKNTKR